MFILRLLLAAVCVAATSCALAQTQRAPASLSGVLTDSQGSGIMGASISLQPRAGAAATAATVTDASGHFLLPVLEPGAYTLTAAAGGFASIAKPIVVDPGSQENLSLTLRIAGSQTTVIVTATRQDRSIADVPASVSVVTGDQLDQTPARTIDDVLRRVPSVDLPVASTNEQHPTDTIVSMRGLSGIRSLVLLDGAPLNDPFFGFVQWSEVPLQTVERVEVVRGGGSTLWGNYAMGGVINVLTRRADRTELILESAGGNRGSYRTDGHAAFSGKSYGVGLDAGESHSNGYVEQADAFRGPITIPTSFTASTAAVLASADLSAALNVRGRISHYSNAQNFLTRLNTNGEGAWRYTAALNWTPRAGQVLGLDLFHNDERFSTNNTGTPGTADPLEAEYTQNIHRTLASDTGASLIWTGSYSGMVRSLSAGADYHGVHGTDAANIYDEDHRYSRTDLGSGSQRFLGAFFQAEVRPLRRLQVLFSLRYQDFYNFNGLDNTPGGLGTAVPTRHDGAVDPRISVRYQLLAGFAFRGAAYRAFRAPTLDNLYRTASVPGYILYGNPLLAPETLGGGEAGFDFDRGGLRFQATAFDSRLSNLLTYRYLDPATLPAGFGIGGRLINAGSAYSRGFEAEGNWRITSRWSAAAGYTYAQSVVTSNVEDPASVGVQQPGVPKNRATAGVDWTPNRFMQISPKVRYLSRTSGDPDNLYHTDPHFVADLALSVPLRHGAQAFAQVENLLNRRYIGTNDGFTAPLFGKPITATVGIRLKLR